MQCHYIVRSTTIPSAVRRARVASSRNLLPPETQPAHWGLRACHANAGCALAATARTSHHGLAWKERGLPLVQCPSLVRRTSQRSTTRAHSKLACFATSRETASVVALARRSRESRLRVGGHSSHVEPRSRIEGERPPTGAVPFRDGQTDDNQRGTARVRGKLTCFPTSRGTASAVALARRSRESRLCAGGHSLHVAPRSYIEEQRPPAGAVPFHVA